MNSEAGSALSFLVAETLLERIRRMRRDIPGVRESEDIEYVHRMRVGSRRLRAALEAFPDAFPQHRLNSWKKRIRKVTRALGTVRDLDVQIDYLSQFIKHLDGTTKKKGADRLLLRLKQARSAAQVRVRSALDKLDKKDTLNEMEREMRRYVANARAVGLNGTREASLDQAGLAINQRLSDFLSYEFYIGGDEPAAELHDMRIAAKRLRYTMEVFAPLYDESFKDFIRSVHKAQNLLGDMNDANVMLECLPCFLEEESERTKKHFGHLRGFAGLKHGILAIEKERRDERDKLYREFLKFWSEHKQKNTWHTLHRMKRRYSSEEADKSPP